MSDVSIQKTVPDTDSRTIATTGADSRGGKLPGAGGLEAVDDAARSAAQIAADEHERNAVFGSLVKSDDDIVGLVAYSIYKQNKHDWLVSFNKAKGREPAEAEAASYIIGESTPRRLAIYRHLAQATLEGRGPQVGGGLAKEKFVQRSLTNGASAQSGGSGKVAWAVIGLGVAAVLIFLAAKYGLPGVSR